ncbi:hypothetical protein JCM11491_002626 [Sporobolomyces phaffii]
MPLTLKILHLDPTSVSSIPDQDSPEDTQFRASLLEEALELLDSDLWTDRKEHHDGVVETSGLPVQEVRYMIQGTEMVSPTGQRDGEGIAWHRRISKLKTSEYGGYDEWWSALGANHTTQEKEYVDNLKELIDIGKEDGKKGCYLKLYKLPFGATDRAFMCRSLVINPNGDGDSSDDSKSQNGNKSGSTSDSPLSNKPGSRSFLSFSLPITTPEPHPAEKKYVRGTTVTVERISEEDEGRTIRWSCASLSTPGGSIPVKLGESKMAASLAGSVPPILEWIKTAHPKGSGTKGTDSAFDSEEASAKAPVAARVTKDPTNPGGGMGLMPTGRFTLEMFQRPVKLRDF